MNPNSELMKALLVMGGANVAIPQNVKDVKKAELNWSDKLEDAYIYVQKALQGLDQEELKTMVKRVYLDYLKPTTMIDLMDYAGKDLVPYHLDYLHKHQDEREDTDAIIQNMQNLIKGNNDLP